MRIDPEDLNEKARINLLRKICLTISQLPREDLEGKDLELINALVAVLEDQSSYDWWGTEGWEHYFGLD